MQKKKKTTTTSTKWQISKDPILVKEEQEVDYKVRLIDLQLLNYLTWTKLCVLIS